MYIRLGEILIKTVWKLAFAAVAVILVLVSVIVLTSGSGDFDSVLPPINEYPISEDYSFGEVIKGTLIIDKSFSGNKTAADTLYLMSNTETASQFELGEVGTVTYNVRGESYKYTAKVVENSNGVLKVKHSYDSVVPLNFPGTFSVVVKQLTNCTMIPKKCIALLDEDGNALAYTVDSNNHLVERQIVVGVSNNEYYEVVSGIEAGTKVVVR